MRFRNKKTGEIITLKSEGELALLELIKNSLPNGLNVWEEVKEPLIKVEKIRKAVRAWAEANSAEKVAVQNNYCLSAEDDEEVEIVFATPVFENYDDDDFYTIAELCGEEEE